MGGGRRRRGRRKKKCLDREGSQTAATRCSCYTEGPSVEGPNGLVIQTDLPSGGPGGLVTQRIRWPRHTEGPSTGSIVIQRDQMDCSPRRAIRSYIHKRCLQKGQTALSYRRTHRGIRWPCHTERPSADGLLL